MLQSETHPHIQDNIDDIRHSKLFLTFFLPLIKKYILKFKKKDLKNPKKLEKVIKVH